MDGDGGETRTRRQLGWILGIETLKRGSTELGFHLLLHQAEAARPSFLPARGSSATQPP